MLNRIPIDFFMAEITSNSRQYSLLCATLPFFVTIIPYFADEEHELRRQGGLPRLVLLWIRR